MGLLTPADSASDEPTDRANPPQRPAQPPAQPLGANVRSLLSLERTRARVSASSRKRALEHGCEILAGCNALDAREVLDALLAREKLGSTALGEGVAIPHCRLDGCTAPVGVLLTLAEPIDYDAPDDEPVDLLFILVVPQSNDEQHLQILAALAEILIEAENRATLRSARDHLTLFEAMQKLSALG